MTCRAKTYLKHTFWTVLVRGLTKNLRECFAQSTTKQRNVSSLICWSVLVSLCQAKFYIILRIMQLLERVKIPACSTRLLSTLSAANIRLNFSEVFMMLVSDSLTAGGLVEVQRGHLLYLQAKLVSAALSSMSNVRLAQFL